MARLSSLFVALGLVLVALTAVVDSFAHSHLGGAVSCSRWGHHHRMPHGGLGVTPASRRPFSPAVAQLRIEDLYSADELEEMTEAEKRAAMNDIGAYAESNMDDSDDMYGDGDGSGGGGVDEAGIKAAARSSILSGGPRGEDSGGKSEAEKKARKVKKSLKRIGQLRKMDYLSLTNDQRTKVHSEPGLLLDLQRLLMIGPEEAEVIRQKAMPGLPSPMPPATGWSMDKEKARSRKQWELERSGKRAGDWECPECGADCFASKDECFKCGCPKPMDIVEE